MRKALVGIIALGVLTVGVFSAFVFVVSGLVIRPPQYEHRSPQEGLRPLDGDAWAEELWQGIHHDPKVDLKLDFEVVEFPAVSGEALRG